MGDFNIKDFSVLIISKLPLSLIGLKCLVIRLTWDFLSIMEISNSKGAVLTPMNRINWKKNEMKYKRIYIYYR